MFYFHTFHETYHERTVKKAASDTPHIIKLVIAGIAESDLH